jgi:hypothetical protein
MFYSIDKIVNVISERSPFLSNNSEDQADNSNKDEESNDNDDDDDDDDNENDDDDNQTKQMNKKKPLELSFHPFSDALARMKGLGAYLYALGSISSSVKKKTSKQQTRDANLENQIKLKEFCRKHFLRKDILVRKKIKYQKIFFFPFFILIFFNVFHYFIPSTPIPPPHLYISYF